MQKIFFTILLLSFDFAQAESILYPIHLSENETIVSFYGDPSFKDLEKKILDVAVQEQEKDQNKFNFTIDKVLRNEVIQKFKAKKVFIKQVDDVRTYEYDLSELDLIVELNAAGGPDFGTFGLQLPKGEIKVKEAIAVVANENPFVNQAILKKVSLVSGTAAVDKNSVLIEKIKSDDRSYILKQNGKNVVLVEKVINGDYSHPPAFILTAPLFKDGSQFFYFDSMGMGNCGKFFIVKEGKIIEEKNPNCGIWGC